MTATDGDHTPMAGKTVVMTGATSGIGAVAAEALARRGARLVIVGRDARRVAATLDRLRRANPAAEPSAHLADLSRLSEMRRVTAAIAVAEPRIDVLANNAGAVFAGRVLTDDGLERTFATNHLAYVVLTLGLKDRLAAAGAARVVNTASAAHRGTHYAPGDATGAGGWRAYARSKLSNILFTRELARRWSGTGITVNCVHPGFVATRFGDATGGLVGSLVQLGKSAFAITPEKGARTLIYLAASPEVAGVTGRYFDRCRPVRPTAGGEDDAAAAALFDQSLALAGLSA